MASADQADVARIKGKIEQVMPVVKATVTAFALEIKGKVDKAPRQPKDRKMRFKTLRQRIYVIQAIRGGLIEFPYRRSMSPKSESLSKSWTIQELEDGLGAAIGNDTSYGPIVQDREKQSLFHQETGWPTVQGVREEMQPKLMSRFQAAVRKALAGG